MTARRQNLGKRSAYVSRLAMRMPRVVKSALMLAVLAMALTSSIASARPEFPGQLAEDADVPCAPVCTICHLVNPGTANSAREQFAFAMMAAGLLTDGAKAAFAVLKANPDPRAQEMVSRLKAGYDPNYPKRLACGPEYGCGAHVAKKKPRDFGVIGWVLAVLSAYALTRRARSPLRR